MAKRSATTELNHDNWNFKEEDEEPGVYTPLSGSQLTNRVIRKAKRSLTNAAASGSNSSTPCSPFAKFSGFSSTAASSPLFSSLNKTNSPFLAGGTTTTVENDKPASTNPFPSSQTNAISISSIFGAKKDTEKTSNGDPDDIKGDKASESSVEHYKKPVATSSDQKQSRGVEYCKQLKSLNDSVLKWMQLHLAKNVCCDFTPVFNDYKKHLDTLNVTYPVQAQKADVVVSPKSSCTDVFKRPSISTDNHADSKATPTEPPKFKAEVKQRQDETDYGAHFSSNTTNTSTFSFGIKPALTATSSNSPLGPASSSKEGAKQNDSEDKKEAVNFSAGFFSQVFQSNDSKPFSFATAPVMKSGDAEKGEEEYEPPKNDFVAVSEEDALYSKRCKLFFKKGDSFAEKGIGTLYLKALEDKTQLLVRADTNLGNILLNIRLSASLPISRTGKNNVLIVCIPNPPVDVKNPNSKEAIPMLIRVKTSEEADHLLETLNKYKS